MPPHSTMHYETTLQIDVIVEYTYVPESLGSTDGRYGPKIEPDEPAHIEIDSIRDKAGNEIPESSVNLRLLAREILEDYNEIH